MHWRQVVKAKIPKKLEQNKIPPDYAERIYFAQMSYAKREIAEASRKFRAKQASDLSQLAAMANYGDYFGDDHICP